MISKNAIGRAIMHPVFTAEAAIQYVLMRKDIEILRNKLRTHFTDHEIKNFSIGASAGIKEIALYLVIKAQKPEVVIETGVAQGISTYFILKAMKENGKGKLISIDLPNYDKNGYTSLDGNIDVVHIPEGMEPGWVIPQELKENWKLMKGKSSDLLPTLENEKFDIFIHDSDHSYENMSFELEWAINHMDKGLIISDDTERNNAFRDFIAKNEKKLKVVSNPLSIVMVNGEN